MSTNATLKEKKTLKDPEAIKIPTNPGRRLQPVYKRVYDDELKKFVVKKVDEIDLYEVIQASASQTDLALIRKQYEATGQIPGTEWMKGTEDIDLAFMPHNIHEVYELANDVNGKFAALPESTRAAFENSSDFLRHVIQGDVNQHVLEYYNKLAEKSKVPEEGGDDK